MKNKLILGLIIFTNVLCFSQELPKIIPPSPTVQNFMRYGEIPVDYSTGVPNINIPLYTVKGKKLVLPISLSYHASGIKVNDISSEVGLGWVLNAGGIVSRTINDIKDELRSGIRTYSNSEQFLNAIPNIVYDSFDPMCVCYPGSLNLEMYLDTKNQNEDLMSDRYFYSLPDGTSGIFRYNYPQENTLITLPYRPFKITKNVSIINNINIIVSFQIVDDKGTVYVYETNTNSNISDSEWYLKKVISADGTDEIILNYQYFTNVNLGDSSSVVSTPKNFLSTNCDPNQSDSYATESQMGSQSPNFEAAVLTSIESSNEIISLIYSDREDFNSLRKISEIRIASKNSPTQILKRISFNQSYFGLTAADKRLKLNSVAINGTDNLQPQTYSFFYQDQMLPPYYSKDQARRVNVDFWGYYNGGNKGSAIHNSFLPTQYQSSQYGDRKADDGSLAKACMIKDIIYPTGGKTSFNFERCYVNEIYASGPSGYIGGFRVSDITNYSANNTIADKKTYQYLSPIYNRIEQEHYAYKQGYIDNYEYISPIEGWSLHCTVRYDRDLIFSNPIVTHDLMPGLPLVYGSVIEFQGTPTNNLGSTTYSYSAPDLFNYTALIREYHTYQNDKGNYQPKLLQKVVKNSDNKIVLTENFGFSDHFIQEFNTGINITRKLDYLSKNKQVALSSYVNDYLESIKAHDTKAYQNAELLDYSIKKTYDILDQNKYISETINYQYYQHNLKEKEISKTNSSGENLVTSFKYPYDFYSSNPYNTMVDKNILTPVIEQISKKNNVQIQKVNNDYKNWGNNIIEPEFVKYQKDTQSPLENRIRFLSYDVKGNVVSLKKEDDIPITYLWGYNKSLPIAEVKNCNSIEQNSIQTESIFNSSFYDPMNLGQNYTLGTFTLSGDRIVTFDRGYVKNNDHEATFYISIYKSGYSLPQISDYLSTSQTDLSVSSSFSLPAGTYTIVINAGYGGRSGPFTNEINFNMSSTVEQKINVPFHTSFEEDIQDVNLVYVKTGRKSHIGSYILKIPPASVGYNQVIVSYWGKINVSSPWVYVENVVNTGSVTDYIIGSSYAYIDEVRMYPLNAQMTTYTYDPLIGVTSITDAKGDTFTYTYDNFGRLQNVKDKDGNILSENEYHYKN